MYSVLGALAQRNINLSKIEVAPRRNRLWHYMFYVDFHGHETDRAVREALMEILKRASFLKLLGFYPAWLISPLVSLQNDLLAAFIPL